MTADENTAHANTKEIIPRVTKEQITMFEGHDTIDQVSNDISVADCIAAFAKVSESLSNDGFYKPTAWTQLCPDIRDTRDITITYRAPKRG